MSEQRGGTIAIGMATYNGAKYIRQQIQSILDNDYSDWHLFIRDDGSDDDTLKVILEYQEHDSRIKIITDAPGVNKGYAANFHSILGHIMEQQYLYFALCDQDDVWQPDKLSSMVKSLESKKDIPALVHSDLVVTDDNLVTISESYFQSKKLDPSMHNSANYLFMENHIPGCSIMGNLALLELAIPTCQPGFNHDWWLAIVASLYGEILYNDKALSKYRQHGQNVIGARGIMAGLTKKINRQTLTQFIVQKNRLINSLFDLSRRFGSPGDKWRQATIEVFLNAQQHNRFQRTLQLYRSGFRPIHSYRWLIYLLD